MVGVVDRSVLVVAVGSAHFDCGGSRAITARTPSMVLGGCPARVGRGGPVKVRDALVAKI